MKNSTPLFWVEVEYPFIVVAADPLNAKHSARWKCLMMVVLALVVVMITFLVCFSYIPAHFVSDTIARMSLYHLIKSSLGEPLNFGKIPRDGPLITLLRICSSRDSWAVVTWMEADACKVATDVVPYCDNRAARTGSIVGLPCRKASEHIFWYFWTIHI